MWWVTKRFGVPCCLHLQGDVSGQNRAVACCYSSSQHSAGGAYHKLFLILCC